ncbi:MAG: hypothetical protein EU542_00735 [Promethearchaeota archaeon]|nr:MAG: hypothetical protein EU542_00735 [Candidatus Lokiarchaeota archaeon]
MEQDSYENTVREITKIVLMSPQKMIRREDIVNLSRGFDFEKIISDVYLNLTKVGFEFISSNFLGHKYYILTSEGKDDNISPSQYGTLALIIALSREVDENLNSNDLKEMFFEVWDTDIQFLIDHDYLRKDETLNIIKVTPLGKALLKDIIQDLELKKLLNFFKS